MRRSRRSRSGKLPVFKRSRSSGLGAKGTQAAQSKCMTRRAFIVGTAAMAGLMLWRPQVAFADEPWWDGSFIFRGYGKWYENQFWSAIGVVKSGNGGAQSGALYTDRWVSAKTPWVEWDISSNQYLRTASKITMQCDFTTELYYHLTGVLEIACGSYNGRNASYNMWHADSGDDTRFSLYHAVDDAPAGGRLEESKVVAIDNEAGSGIHKDGAQIWTDYRRYPQNSYSVWIRRSSRAVKHSFQLRSWFWNYYYFGTDWYFDRASDPPIGYSTKWIDQQSERISIASNATWGNRIVTVESVAAKGKYLESADVASKGARCLVSSTVPATKQHWILLENENVDVAGTYRFVPVVSTDGAFQLDQSGGGPTMTASAAQLWNAAGNKLNRAQSFWIHGSSSTQWVFADCSGMALDSGGSTGKARFHSNGYPDKEWSNAAHKWRMSDARFSTADQRPFSLHGTVKDGYMPVGQSVTVPDPDSTFRPGGSTARSRGIRRTFTWVVLDDEFVDEAFPEIVGSAYISKAGWLEEQPGVNLVGTTQGSGALAGVSLRIEGGSLQGTVSARLSSNGAWRDGATAGSAANAVSLSLHGAISQQYRVFYRACSSRSGWGSWTSEGKSASGPARTISGIQVRLEPKGIAQQGEASSITLDKAWSGKFLTCIVRAEAQHRGIPYRGAALSYVVRVGKPVVLVSYVVDDDSSPCYEERIEVGTSYSTPAAALEAGRKQGCSDFDGWYVDKSCETLFEDGSCLQGKRLTLYGRNIATVEYALTDDTKQLLEERECFVDESLTQEATAIWLVPASETVRYGTRLRFRRLPSMWYEDRGRTREATNVPGVFLDAGESSAPAETLKVTGDATLYLAWRSPHYEGIAVS